MDSRDLALDFGIHGSLTGKQVRFGSSNVLPGSLGIGGSAQIVRETGTEQEARPAGQNPQMGVIVEATDEDKNVRKRAAWTAKGQRAWSDPKGDHMVAQSGGQRPMRMRQGHAAQKCRAPL